MEVAERLKTSWQKYYVKELENYRAQGERIGEQRGERIGEQKGEQKGEDRIISLLEQGYTLEQIKQLRAQSTGSAET
jgi:predicted transposase YdaD